MIKFKSMNLLNELHFDVLCEIGNIGLGNAISSLSALIGKPVKMTVPKVKLLDFSEITMVMGNPEDLIFGIMVSVSGDINGMMMFTLSLDSARILINEMMDKDMKDAEEFTDIDLSALEEIGNILCSSYLNALATLINKRVTPSVPMLGKDMAQAILSVPAIEFSKISDKVLFIDSVFNTTGESASGYFILVPDMESFNTILSALGVI